MNFPNTPYQAIPEPLPPPSLEDLGGFCLTVDGKWIPYLIAAIKTLAIERTWLSDSQRVTDEARNLMAAIASAKPCETFVQGGTELGECMSCCIRVSDGKIQTFNCGVWETIEGGDIAALIGGQSAAAQGAPQPPPGGCEQFLGKVIYGGRWLLPVPVSSGYTFVVTNALGATSGYIHDGLTYRCGDGLLFLAGGCVFGSETFDGGNPMPSAPRDALIAFDGTNYYDCSPAANSLPAEFTVPPGITEANLVLLINNQDVGGAGDLSFDIRVCKPAASPIFITYAMGSGPAAATEGEVFTITSTCCGGGGSGDWMADFSFSVPVKLTVFNEGTFALVGCTTHDVWMKGYLSGSDVQIHYCDTSTHLTDWSNASTIDRWQAECGACGSAWTAQVKVSRA
jgi:hypothetical protein